jgi:hypothetical protein
MRRGGCKCACVYVCVFANYVANAVKDGVCDCVRCRGGGGGQRRSRTPLKARRARLYICARASVCVQYAHTC